MTQPDPTAPPCVICAARKPPVNRPTVDGWQCCWPDRETMDANLAAIPNLAALLPAAVGAQLSQPLSRGPSSHEPPLPGGDALNLTVRSNDDVPTVLVPAVRIVREVTLIEVPGYRPVEHTEFTREHVIDDHGQPVLIPDGDQVGELGPWVLVARWTRQWAALRGVGEVGAGGIQWLRDRLDWACRDHPDLPGFAAELRACVAGMRAVLNLGPRVVRYGNRCPACQNRGTLWRVVDAMLDADDRRMAYVNCSTCPALFEVDDERVTKGQAA